MWLEPCPISHKGRRKFKKFVGSWGGACGDSWGGAASVSFKWLMQRANTERHLWVGSSLPLLKSLQGFADLALPIPTLPAVSCYSPSLRQAYFGSDLQYTSPHLSRAANTCSFSSLRLAPKRLLKSYTNAVVTERAAP